MQLDKEAIAASTLESLPSVLAVSTTARQ